MGNIQYIYNEKSKLPTQLIITSFASPPLVDIVGLKPKGDVILCYGKERL